MTLSPLAFLSLFLCPYLLGVGVLRRIGIGARGDALGHAGWSLMAGGLATGAVLFVACWFSVPLDVRWLVPLLLGLAGALAWCTPGPVLGAAPRRVRHPAEEWLFRLVVALVVLTVVAAILRGSTRALVVNDEARIWAIKAKTLFDSGGLNEAYGARTHADIDSHADYPLLNPLLQLWAFVHAGEIVAVENRFPIQVFVLALVFAGASALRQVLRPGCAAALLLIMQTTPLGFELTRAAGADQMVALGMIVALDGLLRAQRGGDERGYRLAALGMAFAVSSKNEGAAYVLALLAAAVLARRGFRAPPARVLAWLALPALALLASLLVRARFQFENDLVNTRTAGLLVEQFTARIAPLTELLGRYFFARPADHADLFGFFLVLVVIAPKRLLRPRTRLATLFLALLLCGWWLIYIGTPHDLRWHVISSARRLVYSAFPAGVLWFALILAQDPWLGPHLRARGAKLAAS